MGVQWTFLGSPGLNKLRRSYRYSGRRERDLETVEMLFSPVKIVVGGMRGWLSKAIGARCLGTSVQLVCAL